MFNKNLILLLFAFIFFQNLKIFSLENRCYEQIVSQVDDYNIYIEKILTQLQCKFNFLENIKKREEILQLFIQIRFKELEYTNKYQFITAQDSRYFAYQVIAKELYETIKG